MLWVRYGVVRIRFSGSDTMLVQQLPLHCSSSGFLPAAVASTVIISFTSSRLVVSSMLMPMHSSQM